ncbi:MAG: hypothetical protein A3F90_08910 [Deltaproteobacteria bacterium RIFCSPLOWO2_12_FULL_60_19]|nr:MAG: hypothetical protein A3F90_08910 [Deltaproteobacteria bacterium RIFCSPLOWO2_12_FULL_60_19]
MLKNSVHPSTKLRPNGGWIEIIGEFPFVLALEARVVFFSILLGGDELAGRAGEARQPAGRGVSLQNPLTYRFTESPVDLSQMKRGDLSVLCLYRLMDFLNQGSYPGLGFLVLSPFLQALPVTFDG